MMSQQAPVISDAIACAMQELVEAGTTQPELIAAMRDAGLSIIPSIKLLARFYGMSINDAKAAVHLSETWADCRQSSDALHDAAIAAAEQCGFQEIASSVREEVAL